MSSPETVISIGLPQPIDDSPDVSTISVTLHPSERPQLAVTFDYLVSGPDVASANALRLEPRAGITWDRQASLSVGFVRDLPLARWERIARAAAEEKIAGTRSWAWTPNFDDVSSRAVAIVKEMHPELDPADGKAQARRWNRLIRLAEVVQEHQAARIKGAKSPAGEVAARRGVEPSTVRSWLHQAKQEGLTPGQVTFDEFLRMYPGLVEYVQVSTGVIDDDAD